MTTHYSAADVGALIEASERVCKLVALEPEHGSGAQCALASVVMIQRVLARVGIARIYENSRANGNKCPIRTVSLYTFTQGTQMNSLVR
jgi:hypothetical protein